VPRFSEALRMELLDLTVRVTTAYPGHIDTEGHRELADAHRCGEVQLRAQLA